MPDKKASNLLNNLLTYLVNVLFNTQVTCWCQIQPEDNNDENYGNKTKLMQKHLMQPHNLSTSRAMMLCPWHTLEKLVQETCTSRIADKNLQVWHAFMHMCFFLIYNFHASNRTQFYSAQVCTRNCINCTKIWRKKLWAVFLYSFVIVCHGHYLHVTAGARCCCHDNAAVVVAVSSSDWHRLSAADADADDDKGGGSVYTFPPSVRPPPLPTRRTSSAASDLDTALGEHDLSGYCSGHAGSCVVKFSLFFTTSVSSNSRHTAVTGEQIYPVCLFVTTEPQHTESWNVS